METGVVTYNITDAAIAEMESIYMTLTITDLDDKEQFDSVHSARMTVKGKRVEVEKRRKELKADALEWGKKVDTEAKRIFGKLEPIESHLDREEKKVTDEQKRIKEEADRQERLKIEGRMAELAKWGKHLPFFDVAGMDDETFTNVLSNAITIHEMEQKRLADEAAARKAESERLEKVRQEQAAEAARIAEQQRQADDANRKEREKIQAERDAIAAEKRALEDAKRAEQERKDREAFEAKAKEEARIAAEFKAAAEAARIKAELEEKAEREAAEKARQEALKPDKEKLIEWCEWFGISGNVPAPVLEAEEAKTILYDALHALDCWVDDIRKRAEEL